MNELTNAPAANSTEKTKTHEPPAFPADLFEKLKACVRQIAQEEKVPVYMVSAYKPLEWVAAVMPENADQLEALPGFGKSKVAKCGKQVLATIEDWRRHNPDYQPAAFQLFPQKKKKEKRSKV